MKNNWWLDSDEQKTIEARINASFGIACYPTDSGNFYDLLRLSDLAMYYVKGRGRNNIAYIKLKNKYMKQGIIEE